MDVSLGRKDGQYIFGIDVVRGKNFYGYAPTESLFLKVTPRALNASWLHKVVDLQSLHRIQDCQSPSLGCNLFNCLPTVWSTHSLHPPNVRRPQYQWNGKHKSICHKIQVPFVLLRSTSLPSPLVIFPAALRPSFILTRLSFALRLCRQLWPLRLTRNLGFLFRPPTKLSHGDQKRTKFPVHPESSVNLSTKVSMEQWIPSLVSGPPKT